MLHLNSRHMCNVLFAHYPRKLYTTKQRRDVAALQHMHQKFKKYSLLEKSNAHLTFYSASQNLPIAWWAGRSSERYYNSQVCGKTILASPSPPNTESTFITYANNLSCHPPIYALSLHFLDDDNDDNDDNFSVVSLLVCREKGKMPVRQQVIWDKKLWRSVYRKENTPSAPLWPSLTPSPRMEPTSNLIS